MVILKILKRFRVNGETPPTAPEPAKVAANATALLTRFGYTADEIAEIATADDAKLGVMFTSRHSALETDVIARKGKEISTKANFDGMKHAYTQAEKRILEKARNLGVEISEDEAGSFDEKERLEGITELMHTKLKVANPNASENEKVLQQKLESTLKSDAAKDKQLKEMTKKLAENEAAIPKIREELEANFFAEREWKGIALNPKLVETLSVTDPTVLTDMVTGRMARSGHRFVAEKATDGFRLQVVDKAGAYVQIEGAAGNHSAETYINSIYASLVRKSNAGIGGNGAFEMPTGGEGDKKLSNVGSAAVQKMIDQAKASQQ